jgi:hypothetical protein
MEPSDQMNTKPRFNIGDRVKARFAYDPERDEFYPTDDGDEGVIFGVIWNPSGWNSWEDGWVYHVRWDRHSSPHLPKPFWDPDLTPEGELAELAKKTYLRPPATMPKT